MNKKYRFPFFFVFIVLVGIIGFIPRFVTAQATTTQTPTLTVTVTDTITSTPSATPTFTPTIPPTDTQTPTVAPPETQIAMPTPVSVEDIHSGFVDDLSTINEKLDNIYDKVNTPPGWFLVENFLSDYIYDKLNPSASSGGTSYLLFKLLGVFSVSLKLVITMVRVTGQDKNKGKYWDIIATSLIFVYALIFVLVLFFPPNIQPENYPTAEKQPSLSQLDKKLDEILIILNTNSNQAPPSAPTDEGASTLSVFQDQLSSISNQLNEMQLQNEQTTDEIKSKLDELNSSVQETESVSAKIGLQIFNTLLLLTVLGFLIYSHLKDRGVI